MQKCLFLTSPAGEHPVPLLENPDAHDQTVNVYGHPSAAKPDGDEGRCVWKLTICAATEAGIVKRFIEFGRGGVMLVDHRDLGSVRLDPINAAAEAVADMADVR